MAAFIDMTGEIFGLWAIVERADNIGTSAAWLCRCICGTESVVKGTDLRAGVSLNCGCKRRESVGKINLGKKDSEHPAWAGCEVGYTAAHDRVRRARGRASEHACADCGESASEWSYRGDSPEGRIEASGAYKGRAYGPNPNDYDPRCGKCHFIFDSHGLRRDERGRLMSSMTKYDIMIDID